MDECLLKFCLEDMVICRVNVEDIQCNDIDTPESQSMFLSAFYKFCVLVSKSIKANSKQTTVDLIERTQKFHIKACIYGEQWNLQKHPQGTEVKVIASLDYDFVTTC